jgi:hypothetical protein
MKYPSQTQSTNTRLYKTAVQKAGQYRDKHKLDNLSQAILIAITKAELYDKQNNT